MKTRRSHKGFGVARNLGAFAVLAAATGLVVHCAQLESSVKKLEREAKSRGLFDSPAKHQRRFTGPTSAVFFKGVVPRLKTKVHGLSKADKSLFHFPREWTTADVPGLRRVFSSLEPLLGETEAAAKLPMGFATNYANFFEPMSTELMGVFRACSTIQQYARFLALDGRRLEALKKLDILVRLSERVEQEDTGSGNSATWSLRRDVLESVAEIVAVGRWSTPELRAATHLVENLGTVRPNRNHVRNCLSNAWRVANDLKGALDICNSSCTPIPAEQYAMAAYPPAQARFRERALKGSLLMDDWLTRNDLGSPLSVLEAVEQGKVVADPFWDASWLEYEVPRPVTVALFVLQQRVSHAVTQGLLEALLARAESGQWPKLLRHTLDPYTGQPLVVQRLGSQLVIHCEGSRLKTALGDSSVTMPESSCAWPDTKWNRL